MVEYYLHADRAGRLCAGDVIRLEKYKREESKLTLLASCLDQELYSHIEQLLSDGISLHGAQYLLTPNKAPDFYDFIHEMVYENYRFRNFPQKPSRLQSLFAFGNLTDALLFSRKQTTKPRVFRVSSEEDAQRYDMNGLKLNFDPKKQEEYARRYWEGKPLYDDADYQPSWEFLLTLPVKIIEEIAI